MGAYAANAGCKKLCLLSLLMAGIALPLSAANYYVDQNHADASDSNAGTSLTKPWKTVTKANSTLQPGDTVFIRTGTYKNQYICPSRSGTGDNKRIVYTNYKDEKVKFEEAKYGVYLPSRSYITVNGLNFHNLDSFLQAQKRSNHNIISHCVFDGMRKYIGWRGTRIDDNSQYNWVHQCSFSRYGHFTGGNDHGSVFELGNTRDPKDQSYYNLIEDNIFCYGGHHVFSVASGYNVVRNNYVHNEAWSGGFGNRCMQVKGTKVARRNLIEGNRLAFAGIAPDDAGGQGLKISAEYNIVRKNCIYYCNSGGITFTITKSYPSPPNNNYVYNNTVYHNGYGDSKYTRPVTQCGIGFAHHSGQKILGNRIKNNIMYGNYKEISYGFKRADIKEPLQNRLQATRY